jgi:hypothetical protein
MVSIGLTHLKNRTDHYRQTYTVGHAAIATDGLQVSIHGQLVSTECVRLLAELEALKDDGATIDAETGLHGRPVQTNSRAPFA